jgi:hypothetical protein
MDSDIRRQITELVDRGAEPVSLREIRELARTGTARPPRRPGRIAATAGGVATAGAAAALALAVTSGGHEPAPASTTPSARTGAVTAATVRHVASASMSALAYSGRALVSYQNSGTAVQPNTGTDDITFSGENWNEIMSENIAGHVQQAVNRVVDGQAYNDFPTSPSSPGWVHDTAPDAVQALDIPDPRTLLAALRPDAGFTAAGDKTIGGVRLEGLRATRLATLSGFVNSLPWAQSGEHLTALMLWADPAGVVRGIDIALAGTTKHYPISLTKAQMEQLLSEYHGHLTEQDVIDAYGRGVKPVNQTWATTVTVTFTGIGQPQTITAPSKYTDIHGQG